MISLILLNICFVIFVYNIYLYLVSRPANFPPGPPKIPYVGSYILMLFLDRKHLQRAANKLCQFYKSTIIAITLGNDPTLIVNDLKSVKEVLNHRDLEGRPDILLGRLRHPSFGNYGITLVDGELWHEQRRFALRYMRDYGFGRRFDSLEKEVEIQIAQFIDIVKNGPKYQHEQKYIENDKLLLPYAFGPTFANCFLNVLLNEPLARENMTELGPAVESVFVFQRSADNYGKLYSVLPWLAKLFPGISGYTACRESSMDIHKFFAKIVDEQVKTFDPSHERHFIDMYLNKMRQAQDSDQQSYFSIDQLVFTCLDFFIPTVTSAPQTVVFLLQQICHEPEVQQKIQAEIDNIVGQGRAPTLDDRMRMPYTEACIREIMRFETIIPSGVPRRAVVDTELLGYKIAKGTFVMPALAASSHDPTAWDAPEKFRPERFLDESGQLCLSKDISLPFGAGRRLCAGETFSRNMLFLFATAFLQAFSVRMPDGEAPLKFSDNLTGIIRTSPNHWIKVTSR